MPKMEIKMSKSTNVQNQLETIEKVLNAALNVLEGMKDGERMQLKHLAEVVALSVAMTPKEVLPFVNSFAHKTDLGYVSVGKNGGLVKGAKVSKPVKTTKSKKDTSSSSQ